MENMVITIARSYGSGGRTLGKKLADELGIPVYDRQLLRMASDESGISEEMFGMLDESLKRLPIFKTAGDAYKGEVYSPESDRFTSDDNLFRYQARVIRGLADEGPCIILGRCADYVLKDHPGVIRLFFYASMDNCIKRVIEQQGGNEKEVRERIKKIDRLRANYYKFYTGHDWNDVTNYDMCVDTASMSYDKLIRVVKAFISEKTAM